MGDAEYAESAEARLLAEGYALYFDGTLYEPLLDLLLAMQLSSPEADRTVGS
jgi:hypothetical protein